MGAPRERNHQIDYLEFGTNDLPATKRFYQSVFGWTFTDYGPDYTSFEDGRVAGGFRTDGPPGASPLVVIYAADLAATRAKVAAAGCTPFNDHEFPGGRRFHVVDPGGNQIAVWSDQ
jgi:predicted enzyme related to lactoylglutathione lyase